MLQGLPYDYTRSMLIDFLERNGFGGHMDFVYVPCDFRTGRSFGYAFVNFTSTLRATNCWLRLEGLARWEGVGAQDSTRVCEVSWAVIQGLEPNVERYRNSAVMHSGVPDEMKPAILGPDGLRRPFPEPTGAVKAPKRKARAA